MTQATLVIADDDEAMRYLLRRLMRGYEVVGEAANGQEAVAAVKRLSPDVVLMDVSMPVMNGFEAARAILEHRPEVHIIFVSMHTGAAYADEAFRIGAKGYVLKRSAASEVGAAVIAVLAGHSFRSPQVG